MFYITITHTPAISTRGHAQKKIPSVPMYSSVCLRLAYHPVGEPQGQVAHAAHFSPLQSSLPFLLSLRTFRVGGARNVMWIYPVQSRALIPYHLYPPLREPQYLLAQFVPLRSSKGTRDIRLRFHDISKGNKAHQGTMSLSLRGLGIDLTHKPLTHIRVELCSRVTTDASRRPSTLHRTLRLPPVGWSRCVCVLAIPPLHFAINPHDVSRGPGA